MLKKYPEIKFHDCLQRAVSRHGDAKTCRPVPARVGGRPPPSFFFNPPSRFNGPTAIASPDGKSLRHFR